MPLVTLITGAVLVGTLCFFSGVPSNSFEKWVILSFLFLLDLGFVPSSIYCFRHGKWIWGSVNTLIFLSYTASLIDGNF